MDTQKLRAILGGLSGHLVADSAEQEREVERLHYMLSRSLVPEDIKETKQTSFTFENADLFSEANIKEARAESIRSLAEMRVSAEAEPEYRVFVREVPIRSTQIHGSLPLWAGGAAIERSIGPITRSDGRQFWFDFIRIEKLVALYVQGKPEPALLFKVRDRSLFVRSSLPLTTNAASSYNLSSGSIWINSRLLAADAPAGYYTGLTIQGGTIALSATPVTIDGKLTAQSSTIVRVDLRLRQVDAPAGTSSYGTDARDARLQLPERFSFNFSGAAGSQLDEISPARWKVYGHEAAFRREGAQAGAYDDLPHRVLIPLTCSEQVFEVADSRSPFHTLSGRARIRESAWALPAAPIDILNPSQAAGIGGLLVKCGRGLEATWRGLSETSELRLNRPYIIADPGRISVADKMATGATAHQRFELWRDEQNPHGTTLEVKYTEETPYFYFSFAEGNEALMTIGNADARIDRPVTVKGEPPAVRSKNTIVILGVSEAARLIYLFDDNILLDNLDLKKKPPVLPKPIALALNNALFKTTPINGCLLFGQLAEDLVKVSRANLFLTFGLLSYLPTLPDPYAANVKAFIRLQMRGQRSNSLMLSSQNELSVFMWLVCQVKWLSSATPEEDKVEVSFHFAPLQQQFGIPGGIETLFSDPQSSLQSTKSGAAHFEREHAISPASPLPVEAMQAESSSGVEARAVASDDVQRRAAVAGVHAGHGLPDYEELWNRGKEFLQADAFSLLDVSTNADLLGVSFGVNAFGGRQVSMRRTHAVVDRQGGEQQLVASNFPFQVEGMDVVSAAGFARTFMLPQISWEPLFNLSEQIIKPGDPPLFFNYYPNDGGPSYILNNSPRNVKLAPLPLTDFLVDSFSNADFFAIALFGMPFGMKALALLKKDYPGGREGTRVGFNSKPFEDNITGARQIRIDAGQASVKEKSRMFMGSCVQLNNVLGMDGVAKGDSTLGFSVTMIFNDNDFFKGPPIQDDGVPLTRIDMSGYGASIFSNWLNPKAPLASTSQAKFDVFVGRCAHEIVQVVSILYPWGIKVVRTITLRREASGYEFRHDSGWKAESEGLFDFRHYCYDPATMPMNTIEREGFYEFHPGCIGGLFNVKDIKETTAVQPFFGKMRIGPMQQYIDGAGILRTNGSSEIFLDYFLQPVFFNADVDIEDPISGFSTAHLKGKARKLVASKAILGFVQLKPLGQPLTVETLHGLIERQGTIGAPIDCVIDIGKTGQQMRVNRFDVSNSVAADGASKIFVVSARGSVVLPKEGSWGLVKHEHETGEVSPVPQELSVPLIRAGKLTRQGEELAPLPKPENELLRIANPTEILRSPQNGTINYGFLFTSDTQKALFLNPAFKASIAKSLLSKTPPLFADAFRLVNSKAIFPNIGNAVTNIGDCISLDQGGSKLKKVGDTYQLLQINREVGGILEEGYKLIKKADDVLFDLPSTEWELIDIGTFRIYIEYKADKVKKGNAETNMVGKLDFNINSFAGDVTERWKSRMRNVALVVDLKPVDRLMTIKGNWDSKKGKEAEYGGSTLGDEVPQPQIQFAEELKPAMDILQILQDLQGANYKEAFGRGVRLAMSNKAATWEYKFEASKEIPVIRFPPPLLDSPLAPLKLEAGLRLGAYFNAALKVPSSSNPSQLLPTAGGFLGFYGRLSVMCVSLAAATIYAVGQVNLDIGADTKTGPMLRMKFGFGAQIVVGLPVVGSVSLLYMVGVEIYTDAVQVQVSAFLLFQGKAELLAGLVSITITIEARGTVTRQIGSGRTDLAAQVTFAIEISIFLIIDISFSESWEERRQIA